MSTLAHTTNPTRLNVGDKISGHSSPGSAHPIPFGAPATVTALACHGRTFQVEILDHQGKRQLIRVPEDHIFFLAA